MVVCRRDTRFDTRCNCDTSRQTTPVGVSVIFMRLLTGVAAGVIAFAAVGASTPALAYTVRPGDTLWSIALHTEGGGHDWRQITDDRGHHPAPRQLWVGENLRLPPMPMYPATSQSPTAGFCTSSAGRVVTVRLLDDMSDARCYQVRPGQHLRIVNVARQSARMAAPFLRGVVLAPGRSFTLSARFGRYLAPGAHAVGSSLWCCFDFDLFLPGSAPTPSPTAGAG